MLESKFDKKNMLFEASYWGVLDNLVNTFNQYHWWFNE